MSFATGWQHRLVPQRPSEPCRREQLASRTPGLRLSAPASTATAFRWSNVNESILDNAEAVLWSHGNEIVHGSTPDSRLGVLFFVAGGSVTGTRICKCAGHITFRMMHDHAPWRCT